MHHVLWDVHFLSSWSRRGTWSPGVSLQPPIQSCWDEVLGVDFLSCLSRSDVPLTFFPGSVWPPVLVFENGHYLDFSQNHPGNL